MLKKVFINSRKIPIPVPVRTLDEALRWVEETLVPAGHTVTRVVLDGRILAGDEFASRLNEGLGETSQLEVQIDSPVDLMVQALDATRNLASVVLDGIKMLAVECWQTRALKPGGLDAVATDVELILDLIDHSAGLVDQLLIEATSIEGIAHMLKKAALGVSMAKSNSDWKACARLLLNRIEPLLKDLIVETETLQIRVLTHTGTALAQGGRG